MSGMSCRRIWSPCRSRNYLVYQMCQFYIFHRSCLFAGVWPPKPGLHHGYGPATHHDDEGRPDDGRGGRRDDRGRRPGRGWNDRVRGWVALLYVTGRHGLRSSMYNVYATATKQVYFARTKPYILATVSIYPKLKNSQMIKNKTIGANIRQT